MILFQFFLFLFVVCLFVQLPLCSYLSNDFDFMSVKFVSFWFFFDSDLNGIAFYKPSCDCFISFDLYLVCLVVLRMKSLLGFKISGDAVVLDHQLPCFSCFLDDG
jgi:hypothetical protein